MPTTTSYTVCGTAADDGTGWTGVVDDPWTNPTNAQGANDSTYASCLTGTGTGVGRTNYLKCTNYSFSIPAGATINGIQAKVNAKVLLGSSLTDFKVFLIKGGSPQEAGTNQAPGQVISTASTDYVYGATNDLWGATLTSTDVNASNFGVAVSYQEGSIMRTVDVDSVQIAVTYTAATGFAVGSRARMGVGL